jgi:6-pyruvoyltetrahydropterin/6-carboxytetrahydropterin synthase
VIETKIVKAMFYSTKNYPPSTGLSAVFRQWRANSHCRYLHGYALGFRFKFLAYCLDENGWVVDFGSLRKLKEVLVEQYDHRVLVAHDDPELDFFMKMSEFRIGNVQVVDRTGCEAFANQMFHAASALINDNRVRVISCECYEHEANSAIYEELP